MADIGRPTSAASFARTPARSVTGSTASVADERRWLDPPRHLVSPRTRPFDPYAILEVLESERIAYVVIGAFARVVHGSAETTRSIDISPSLRDDDLRRLAPRRRPARRPRRRS
jgi:hypothetical protein